jgi:monoamine oxidase
LYSIDDHVFTGKKAIITIPLGVLKADSTSKAFIRFTPEISSKLQAVAKLGFGEIIKIVIECNEAFWENKNVVGEKRMKKLGFVFADTFIPTWWTQAPVKNPILTGWFGGPKVREWKDLNDESLMQLAIDSLAAIFEIDHAVLVEKIVASQVFNWAKDPYSLGGYSYTSLNRKKYLDLLAKPEEDTLFFSGEALETGSARLGTVEAALNSGFRTAQQILQVLSHKK